MSKLKCRPEDIRKTGVVPLEGYQACMKEGKYGYSLTAVVDEETVHKLGLDRERLIDWCLTKVNNPKRAVKKPEPWEEVAENKWKIKFSWNSEMKPGVVDTKGTAITDEDFPLFGGAQVKLAFFQKPYVLPDQSFGTSLKLLGVQVVELGGEAGVSGAAEDVNVADLFGETEGFVASAQPAVEEDNDF